jgi:hypothetical protein
MGKGRFISRQDAGRGYELQIVDDTGEQVDWFITVAGVDSEAYRAQQREHQRQGLAMTSRKQRLELTPELIEERALDLIVAATLGWRGEDAALPFTAENARKAYRDLPQVEEQVDRAIQNRANFLPRSGTS